MMRVTSQNYLILHLVGFTS